MVPEVRAWALGLWDAGELVSRAVHRWRLVVHTIPRVGLGWLQRDELYRDEFHEVPALRISQTEKGHTVGLDGVRYVDRIEAQCGTRGTRPAGSEMPHPSQGFINGALA